jgi:hypothetical protein
MFEGREMAQALCMPADAVDTEQHIHERPGIRQEQAKGGPTQSGAGVTLVHQCMSCSPDAKKTPGQGSGGDYPVNPFIYQGCHVEARY